MTSVTEQPRERTVLPASGGLAVRRMFLLTGAAVSFATAILLAAVVASPPAIAAALVMAGIGGAALHGLVRARGAASLEAAVLDAVRRDTEPWLITGTEGEVLYANAAARQRLGVAPGSHWPSAGTVVEEPPRADAADATKPPERCTVTLPGAGDSFEAALRPVGGDGALLWRMRDATERRRLEKERGILERRAADLFADAPIGYFSASAEGRLLCANDTLARWVGCQSDDLVGASVDSLLADAAPPIAPTSEPVSIEATLLTRSGRRPVQVVQSWVDDGDGLRSRSMVRDVAQDVDWRSVLRLAEQRFRLLFDAAPIAVLTLDREGRISEANGAFREMSGLGEVAGLSFAELIAAEDRPAVADRFRRALAGEKADSLIEARLSQQAGARLMQLFVGRFGPAVPADPAADPAEGGRGLLLHLVDATDQRNLELRFAQSQKMQAIGQLAGGVAHDFNNLLTAIIGHADLLLLLARPGDKSFPDIMQIKQNANRAANLVRQLLAFSRQQTLRPKVLSLTDVLAELAHLLRRLIGENIELRMQHGRDLGLVKVDQNQFEQVVINLAVNARDAMPAGGVLEIRTGNVELKAADDAGDGLIPPGKYVLIEVEDTGKGIAKEDLGKIFEPFFTTKEPGTAGGSGTGLGLSTVYGIVKQTGGFIFPRSQVGVGTVFSIYLPQHRLEAAAAAAERAEAAPAASVDLTGKGTILLVEDEDAVRVFAARALRSKGYEVLEADCAEAALDLLEAHEGEVDLLVSDVVMPQMDGPTLIRQVRRSLPDIKVIFISGYAEDAFRRSLDPAEKDFELLPKPFSLKQLAGKVKEVMAREAG